MQVDDKIVFNFLLELKRKKVDKLERAKLIDAYMTEHKLSGRGLAKELSIPKSTIEDYRLYLRITPEEHGKLRELGYSEKDIYKELRNNKGKSTEEIFHLNDCSLDRTLIMIQKKLNKYMKEPTTTKNTKRLLKDTQVIINKLELVIGAE